MVIATTLLGGLGLFLLGMRMLTDGLTLSAGRALKAGLEAATRSRARGLAVGVLITAIVQSSSAVTVAAIGFTNAGLMTLTQSVWVIYGTNVGTTMTGWLVALIGVKLEIAAMALPLIGGGMLLRLLAGSRQRLAGAGEAVAGFGAFFLGISILQAGFGDLAPGVAEFAHALSGTAWQVPAFVLIGIALTAATQSSSAAIVIALTATASGVIGLDQAAATVIGTNIGTTSTAVLAVIGATPSAKRVAAMHVIFNAVTGAAALALLPLLVVLSVRIAGGADNPVLVLAIFHTMFNLFGVVLIWPWTGRLVRFLSRHFEPAIPEPARPRYLDDTLAGVPDLALQALAMESARLTRLVFDDARRRLADARRGAGRSANGHVARRLTEEIRRFIGQMNKGELPDHVVEAVSDIIRTLQHLEDLARAADQHAGRGAPDYIARFNTALTELLELTRASLILPDIEPAETAIAGLAALGERHEAAYEAVKAQVLRAGAKGALDMPQTDAALAYARDLRTIGQLARKTSKRLLPRMPLPAVVGEGEGAEGASPEPA